MSIINRHGSCIGLKLWKWNKFQLEVWYCPSGYKIERHSHDNVNIELTYLFGNAMFHRTTWYPKTWETKHDTFHAQWHWWLRTFSIPAGTLHWFEVSKWPLVFMSTERWLTEPTSAAKDFNLKQ